MQEGGRILARKRCARCLGQFPLDKFYRRSKLTNRLSSYCNDCVTAVNGERRRALRRIHDERAVEDFRHALVNDDPINFAALTRHARRELLDLLDAGLGLTAAEIAKRVGCSTVTVYRHRRERSAHLKPNDQL